MFILLVLLANLDKLAYNIISSKRDKNLFRQRKEQEHEFLMF